MRRTSAVLAFCVIAMSPGCRDKSEVTPVPAEDGGRDTGGPNDEPGTEKDCRQSQPCQEAGECTWVDSGRRKSCEPTRDEDCAASTVCKRFGYCQVGQVRCEAKRDEDCAASTVCKRFGYCQVGQGRCEAKRDESCAASLSCAKHGACVARGGWCVPAGEQPCRASEDCRVRGRCSYRPGADDTEACENARGGVFLRSVADDQLKVGNVRYSWAPHRRYCWPRCVAATGSDCASSEECKNEHACEVSREECSPPEAPPKDKEEARLWERDRVTGEMVSRLPRGVGRLSMDRTSVTVAAYKACVDAGKCTPAYTTTVWKDTVPQKRASRSAACNWGKPGRDHHPINCVDWKQARTFCAWAEKRLAEKDEWETEGIGYQPCLKRGPGVHLGTHEVTGADSVLGDWLDMCGYVSDWTGTQVTVMSGDTRTEEKMFCGPAWNDDGTPEPEPSCSMTAPSNRASWLGIRCARGYWKRTSRL